MIKKIKTKKEIQQELEAEIADFLKEGGNIKQIEKGVSARHIGDNLDSQLHFPEPQQIRTALTETIKALEARKQKKKTPPEPKRPRKRVIYDDFGEAIREIWDE